MVSKPSVLPKGILSGGLLRKAEGCGFDAPPIQASRCSEARMLTGKLVYLGTNTKQTANGVGLRVIDFYRDNPCI
jgi:hypothetical protein